MLRWRLFPCLAPIIARKRLLMVLVTGGAFSGLVVSSVTAPVYSASITIPEDNHGTYVGFHIFPPPSSPVRLASRLDAAAVRSGLPNPGLQDLVSQWIDGRR